MNTPQAIELRRRESTLRSLGTGVIAFSLWAIMRPLLLSILFPEEELRAVIDSLGTWGYLVIVVFFLLCALLISSLWLWVGFSAFAEGSGKRKGRGYVIVGLFVFLLELSGTVMNVTVLFTKGLDGRTVSEMAATLLLEISSTLILGEMILTALRVKKLRRAID